MGLAENQQLTEEWLGDQYDFYNKNALQNPFKGKHTHPIEAALMRAKLVSGKEDLVEFKNQRAIILEYLENQYQCISSAAIRLVDFVKEEKFHDGLLDAHLLNDPARHCWDYHRHMEKLGKAMLLVEEYAQSFKRDMPMEIKQEVRQYQRLFDSFYSRSRIRALLWRLREAFEIGNLTSFVDLFCKLVNELDTDYVLILKLRKNLFQFDDLSLN